MLIPWLEIGLVAWLALLALLIVYRILTGGISIDGTLRSERGGPISPERVQLVVGSLLVIGAYAMQALSGLKTGAAIELPEPSAALIAVFAGNHAVYLAGKFLRRPNTGV